MFVLQKVVTKLTGSEVHNGQEFLERLFTLMRNYLLNQTNKSPIVNMDYTESKHLNFQTLELEELSNLMQGYETKFVKGVKQRLEFVENIIDENHISEHVQVSRSGVME